MIKTFNKTVRNFDMFGHGVQLNFAGQESIKTSGGGIMSMIIYVVMITFAGRKLNTMFQYGDDKISINI